MTSEIGERETVIVFPSQRGKGSMNHYQLHISHLTVGLLLSWTESLYGDDK